MFVLGYIVVFGCFIVGMICGWLFMVDLISDLLALGMVLCFGWFMFVGFADCWLLVRFVLR